MRERVENGADPTHIRPEVVGVLCAGSFVCDIVAAGLPQDLLAKVCAEDLEYVPFEARAKGGLNFIPKSKPS